MSLTFSITPRTGFLRRHRAMTVGEVLALREEDHLVPAADDDEELTALWHASLARVHVLGGSYEQSGRGFELSYERGAYRLRQFTPSTMTDWRIALELLSALAQHLEAEISCEDGTTWTAGTITDFPARTDVVAGVRAMSSQADGPVTMPGFVRTVTPSAQTWQRILRAEDPAEAFSAEFETVQRLEAYDAAQGLRPGPGGDPVGVCVLTEGVRTVLLLEPSLDPWQREEAGGEVRSWELVLVAGDEELDEIGAVPYAEALSRVPERKLHEVDAASVLVEALDGDEIRQVAGLAD
jgi:hypothetical protein